MLFDETQDAWLRGDKSSCQFGKGGATRQHQQADVVLHDCAQLIGFVAYALIPGNGNPAVFTDFP